MHEMSLAGGILQLVEQAAAREHFGRVTQLRLEAGKLAAVELSSLRFALEVVSRGTCLEGARVEIDEPPGRGYCMNCGQSVDVHARGQACPLCGSWQLLASGGDQLRIVDLMVEGVSAQGDRACA
jgi:hydrogenase nickel incorporation protein HypA/HybF